MDETRILMLAKLEAAQRRVNLRTEQGPVYWMRQVDYYRRQLLLARATRSLEESITSRQY